MNHIADIVQNSTYTHKRFRKFFVCLLFLVREVTTACTTEHLHTVVSLVSSILRHMNHMHTSRITPYACVNELVTPQSANIASVTYGMEYRKYWMSKKGTSYTPIHQANDKETIQTTRVYKSSA